MGGEVTISNYMRIEHFKSDPRAVQYTTDFEDYNHFSGFFSCLGSAC